MEENTPPKKRGRQGEGGGPKPRPITPDQVRALSVMQCTQEEIASVFGLQRRHFIKRMEDEPALREAWEAGQGQGRMSIRRAQFDLLQAGNVTMAIWLGKQYLGQKDKWETENVGFDGATLVQNKITIELVQNDRTISTGPRLLIPSGEI